MLPRSTRSTRQPLTSPHPLFSLARACLQNGETALLVAAAKDNTKAVEVRFSSRPRRALPASIRREVPAASNQLPSAALGAAGGGLLAVDAMDPEGLRTPEAVFQLELALLEEAGVRIGERVYVRFDHGSEPLALRAFRALRRLLLRHIVV